MFYCNECAEKHKYPETISKSIGICELCNEHAECNDRPSRLLPTPKKPLMLILSYGIFFDKRNLDWVTVESTKYDDSTNEPISWAVKKNSSTSVMSKITGEFQFEPRPSSRDDKFYEEFRFSDPEEAQRCWAKFHTPVCPKCDDSGKVEDPVRGYRKVCPCKINKQNG